MKNQIKLKPTIGELSNNSESEERIIVVIDKNNKKIEGKILFSFEENGDDYVIYELDNQAYGAKVDENNNLSPIEEDEWPLIEKIYEEYMNNEETEESQ